MKVVVDGYTRFILTAIAVLLTVLAVGLWHDSPSSLGEAQAGIPDSGMQLQQILTKMDNISSNMDQIQKVLIDGRVKVQIVEKATIAKPAKKTGKK